MTTTSDFGVLLGRVWTAVRWASLGMIGLTAVVIGREVKNFYDVAAGIHPVVGVLFLGGVGTGLWFGVVRPVRRYWAMPVAVRPTDDQGSIATASVDQLRQRAEFLVRIIDNLARNPRMAAALAEVMAARAEAERTIAACIPGTAIEALRARVEALEKSHVEQLFAPLDEEANKTIRAEALAVGLGTAVSMNGTVDAWIVLWRNLNLVTRLATIYYGRPGVRGSLFVLRDVATAMFLASKLQGVLDGAAGFFGGWFGRTTGTMMGPVADGIVNALVTTRIGYVAKARCRSFQRWTESRVQDVIATCFK